MCTGAGGAVCENMNEQVYAETDKQHRRHIAYPFLYAVHAFGEFLYGDGAVGYQPRDDHNWQSCSQTEDNR